MRRLLTAGAIAATLFLVLGGKDSPKAKQSVAGRGGKAVALKKPAKRAPNAAPASASGRRPALTSTRTSNVVAAKIIAAAIREVGRPYKWGGGGGKGATAGVQGAGYIGFDCSGLTHYALVQAGVYNKWAPKTNAQMQFDDSRGAIVPRNQLQQGDFVFYWHYVNGKRVIGHVGIYNSRGQIIDAPHTGALVRFDALKHFPNYAGARRFGLAVRPAKKHNPKAHKPKARKLVPLAPVKPKPKHRPKPKKHHKRKHIATVPPLV